MSDSQAFQSTQQSNLLLIVTDRQTDRQTRSSVSTVHSELCTLKGQRSSIHRVTIDTDLTRIRRRLNHHLSDTVSANHSTALLTSQAPDDSQAPASLSQSASTSALHKYIEILKNFCHTCNFLTSLLSSS